MLIHYKTSEVVSESAVKMATKLALFPAVLGLLAAPF